MKVNKRHESGIYPLLITIIIINCNIEIVRMLMDYAQKNNIIFDVNEKAK